MQCFFVGGRLDGEIREVHSSSAGKPKEFVHTPVVECDLESQTYVRVEIQGLSDTPLFEYHHIQKIS